MVRQTSPRLSASPTICNGGAILARIYYEILTILRPFRAAFSTRISEWNRMLLKSKMIVSSPRKLSYGPDHEKSFP
jgi:hypothetical protein